MVMTIDTKKLREVNKLCRALCVQVWGSDECRLRKYNEFHDSDVEEIAATMLKLAEENEELKKERSKIFKEGYSQGLDAAKKVLAAQKGDAGE